MVLPSELVYEKKMEVDENDEEEVEENSIGASTAAAVAPAVGNGNSING